MNNNFALQDIHALIIDIDGTLWRGKTPMLGDRLDTDILGGQRAGLKTILLTTGVDTEQTIPQKGIYPDAVFGDLEELTCVWQRLL